MIPMTRSRYLVIILALALLGGFGFFVGADAVRARPLASDSAEAKDLPVFSGTLEARETRIAAEISGRVNTVRASKGDQVKQGDTLIELDDRDMHDSLAQAEAAVKAAQANLDQVQEKARPGAIALAQATVTQAQADLTAAKQALADASRAVGSPQDLTSQMHTWEGKVAFASSSLAQAQAALNQVNSDLQAANDQSMAGQYQQKALKEQQQAAQAAVAAAQISLDGSRRVLALYQSLLNGPLDLMAAQNAAANQVKVAEEGLKVAQAEVDVVQRPAQPEAVALAQAKLKSAQANLELVQAQQKRYTVRSPMSGTVVERNVEAGETVRPGAAVLTIADAEEYQITLYVPIRYMKLLHIGQSAKLRVPSLPGSSFAGHLTYISPDGEFKPANIYNSQERSEIVFAVRVTVPNQGQLKAGLPADVTFE